MQNVANFQMLCKMTDEIFPPGSAERNAEHPPAAVLDNYAAGILDDGRVDGWRAASHPSAGKLLEQLGVGSLQGMAPLMQASVGDIDEPPPRPDLDHGHEGSHRSGKSAMPPPPRGRQQPPHGGGG
eukprot:SAG22_NODE_6144_length_893_cov_1.074307_1_plen_125_part_10